MIRAVIVGFGFMGKTHAINILKSTTFELCAIVDKGNVKDLLFSSGGNFNTGKLDPNALDHVLCYNDLENCLFNVKPDAVIICLPTFLHYETTIKCLNFGCHVFLEKPITLDINEAEEMISLAKETNLTFMVGHCVRFFPEYKFLNEAIRNNILGKLKFIKMIRISPKPNWGSWNDTQVKNSSGGALFDLLIHDIDFLNVILGIPDQIINSEPIQKMFEDSYINSTWIYKSKNVVAVVEGGNCFPALRPFECGFSAIFEKGAIVYNSYESQKVRIVYQDKEEIKSFINEPSGYFSELQYFSKCITEKLRPVECSPEDALIAIKLCYRHLVRK
jgi:predicted dehydrogenase